MSFLASLSSGRFEKFLRRSSSTAGSIGDAIDCRRLLCHVQIWLEGTRGWQQIRCTRKKRVRNKVLCTLLGLDEAACTRVDRFCCCVLVALPYGGAETSKGRHSLSEYFLTQNFSPPPPNLFDI